MLTRESMPRRAPTEIIWDEVAPAEHSVQIYDDSVLFIDALEGFVSGGFRAGESVIVIATAAHRRALARRLRARGFDIDLAQAEDRYIPVDAETALRQFVIDGWPDGELFRQLVGGLLARARANGRSVRAFGEMVALLWNEGHKDSTIRLEYLWNKFIEEETMRLFCAYPRNIFAKDTGDAITEICSHHSRVIPE